MARPRAEAGVGGVYDTGVMARYPRVKCPVCGGVYAGAPTSAYGMVSVHDHKRSRRALVLCEGSMTRVPAVDEAGHQEELPGTEGAGQADPTLF
ncbi:hypothetical protein SAMN05444921_116114 [Streptomyces wuyuanensis]|uniref:Uncharacterized protein n=2 Tax=Streptomyces wuyuanensis TaxID=1196353 RepID=A0A1G9XNZ1_9ACTN|nr:hypothetical protein SAMN05444921_116114 [Streptomyces wuyuanensis]